MAVMTRMLGPRSPGVFQAADLAAHAAAGQLGQGPGVALPGGEGVEHVPAGHAVDGCGRRGSRRQSENLVRGPRSTIQRPCDRAPSVRLLNGVRPAKRERRQRTAAATASHPARPRRPSIPVAARAHQRGSARRSRPPAQTDTLAIFTS